MVLNSKLIQEKSEIKFNHILFYLKKKGKMNLTVGIFKLCFNWNII